MLARLWASGSPSPSLIRSSTAIDVIPQFAIEIPFQPVAPAAAEIEQLRPRLCALVEDQANRRRQLIPARLFTRQLPVARPRERIELGIAACFRAPPLRFQPALLFEPVQRRIQGALIDAHRFARDLLHRVARWRSRAQPRATARAGPTCRACLGEWGIGRTTSMPQPSLPQPSTHKLRVWLVTSQVIQRVATGASRRISVRQSVRKL